MSTPTADEFAFQLFFVFFTRCIMFKTGRHGTAESGAEVSDMTTYTTEWVLSQHPELVVALSWRKMGEKWVHPVVRLPSLPFQTGVNKYPLLLQSPLTQRDANCTYFSFKTKGVSRFFCPVLKAYRWPCYSGESSLMPRCEPLERVSSVDHPR